MTSKPKPSQPSGKTIDFETLNRVTGGFKEGDVHLYDPNGNEIRKPFAIPPPLPKP